MACFLRKILAGGHPDAPRTPWRGNRSTRAARQEDEMKISYRKSLLAGAVAVLVATPGWAGTDASKTNDSMPRAEGTQTTNPRMDTSRANPGSVVYTMTPRELRGKDVIGPGGDEIGSVKAVVHSRQEKDIQAVISAGGFLGVGDKEITIPPRQAAVCRWQASRQRERGGVEGEARVSARAVRGVGACRSADQRVLGVRTGGVEPQGRAAVARPVASLARL